MKIKIKGGTADAGMAEGLCVSCSSATVREDAKGVKVIRCGVFRDNVPVPVLRCSDYRHTNSPSRYDFEKIAWEITTDKRSGKIGFITPMERRKQNPDMIPPWADDE